MPTNLACHIITVLKEKLFYLTIIFASIQRRKYSDKNPETNFTFLPFSVNFLIIGMEIELKININ